MLYPAQQKTPAGNLVFRHNPEARHRFPFLPPPCQPHRNQRSQHEYDPYSQLWESDQRTPHTRVLGAKPSSAALTSNASIVMSSSSVIAAMSAFSLVKR